VEQRNAIIFDLDGVLIDSRKLHFEALNKALGIFGSEFTISIQEQASTYEGLSTNKKLLLLTKNKGLPESLYEEIWEHKQTVTFEQLNQIKEDSELQNLLNLIEENNIQIGVASNSIRKSVKRILLRLGVMDQIEIFLSNEDVVHPKPSPEIYWEVMKKLKVHPQRTVIFEDSHVGKAAAISSGAHLIEVENRSDLNSKKILEAINYLKSTNARSIPWKSKTLNVVIPMAGYGSRFHQAGFTFPKPLIEVNGKPMIQTVVENLNVDARYHYIVQKEHYNKYHLKYLLNLITPNCEIIQVDGVTEGAACTVLLAENLLNTDNPLLIANSDQFLQWNSSEVLHGFQSEGIDGGIVTFTNTHPKWSFVRIDDNGFVSEVAEKKVISNMATVGIYYWKHGSDFVKYAKEMIENNIRTNNEFYIAPVFNEAIKDGKKIRATSVASMWGLGTPEDLKYFLEHHR
jgi:HAD superfamily hydrolase (TIGR01509 family)